ARVRRRARALRAARRDHVARLAFDAARADARPPRRPARHLAPGRAQRRVLRARPGQRERHPRRARPQVRPRGPAPPAVLACPSATAAANSAPAVIEAHEARVPLLVLTADRPPELRALGAGQTIDQVKL